MDASTGMQFGNWSTVMQNFGAGMPRRGIDSSSASSSGKPFVRSDGRVFITPNLCSSQCLPHRLQPEKPALLLVASLGLSLNCRSRTADVSHVIYDGCDATTSARRRSSLPPLPPLPFSAVARPQCCTLTRCLQAQKYIPQAAPQ